MSSRDKAVLKALMLPSLESDQSAQGRPAEIEYRMARQAHGMGGETGGIALSYIQPGKPQRNAHVERCNRTVRHEWLDQHIIAGIEGVRNFATQWL